MVTETLSDTVKLSGVLDQSANELLSIFLSASPDRDVPDKANVAVAFTGSKQTCSSSNRCMEVMRGENNVVMFAQLFFKLMLIYPQV